MRPQCVVVRPKQLLNTRAQISTMQEVSGARPPSGRDQTHCKFRRLLDQFVSCTAESLLPTYRMQVHDIHLAGNWFSKKVTP